MSFLKLERLKKGLTQDDVWIRTGRRLHPSRLSRIERGVLRPTPEDLQLLSYALDLEVGDLSGTVVADEGGHELRPEE
jgi:transcriptional regulator with XRE-family HTH domain